MKPKDGTGFRTAFMVGQGFIRVLEMRRLLASAVLTGLALAVPAWAFAQAVPMPVIPAVKPVHAGKPAAKAMDAQNNNNIRTEAGIGIA